MPKRRKDYRAVLEEYQINTKAGRLKFLVDVVKAYELAYPARFRFYLDQFKKLKQVLNARGFTDDKGREVWADQIPSEPFLYVQRWIPNFGHDPDWPGDMQLLKKAWEDFVCTPKRRHLKHTTLWKGGLRRESPQPKDQEQERPTVFPELSDDEDGPDVGSEAAADAGAGGDAADGAGVCHYNHEGRPCGPEGLLGESEDVPGPGGRDLHPGHGE